MNKEIERKWLPLPELAEIIIASYEPVEIVQFYLCTDPVIRIRKDGDQYYLTYKGKGFLEREEYNLPLNKRAFEEISKKFESGKIRKYRYRVPFDELFPNCLKQAGNHIPPLLMELDIFFEKLDGLRILEVEFETVEAAEQFEAPSLFGEEVTGRKEYTNAFLSTACTSCGIVLK